MQLHNEVGLVTKFGGWDWAHETGVGLELDARNQGAWAGISPKKPGGPGIGHFLPAESAPSLVFNAIPTRLQTWLMYN